MSADQLKRARWLARNRLAGSPRLYLPLAARKYPDAVLGPDTELMIDGFTRSAVVFSTIAFQLAQSRPVRMSHTIHAPGLIKLAVERRIPVLVTLRDPRDVAMSAAIRQPFLTLNDILRAYTRFYGSLRPFVGGFVVGRFEQLSTDLGHVIRHLNERYGTTFDEFDHTEENVREAFEITEDRGRGVPWLTDIGRLQSGRIGVEQYRAIAKNASSTPVNERKVARPSELRESVKERMRSQLEEPALRPALVRALSIFAVLRGEDPAAHTRPADPASGPPQ